MQEDTANLSRRARRRAEAEEAPQAGAGATEGAGPSADGATAVVADAAEAESSAEGEEQDAPAPNRKARRTAAAQARARRKQELQEASAIGLDAGERVDDALARAGDGAGRWLQRNWSVIQWAIVVGVVGWSGVALFQYQSRRAAAKATDAIMAVVERERAAIADAQEAPASEGEGAEGQGPGEAKNVADAYSDAAQLRSGSGAEVFARLAQAGALLEAGDAKAASEAYAGAGAVAMERGLSFLAAQATLGRALSLESSGAVSEALEALKSAGEGTPLGELMTYQIARIQHASGDDQAATITLKQLVAKLGPPGGADADPKLEMLRPRVTQLVHSLDPLQREIELPQQAFDEEAVRRMLEQMQQSTSSAP